MGKISIVGLGPGDYSLISQGALELLQSSNRIFLRTEKHPTVDQLKQQIDYTSLDYFYEKEENFEKCKKTRVILFENGKSVNNEVLHYTH